MPLRFHLLTAVALFAYALGSHATTPIDHTTDPITDPITGPVGVDGLSDLDSAAFDLLTVGRDRANRIVVQVMINDRGPFNFLLDTGANQSAVGAQLAKKLQLTLAEPPVTLLQGVTGETKVPRVKVRKLQAGALLLENLRLPVVSSTLSGLDGVLGVDGFRNKRVAAHIIDNRVTIEQSSKAPTSTAYATFPLGFRHGQLVVVAGGVAGTPVKAIIDTGSQGSLGNWPLRQALFMQGKRALLPTRAQVQGVTGGTQFGEKYLTSLIRIEYKDKERQDLIAIDDVAVVYGDFYVFELWKLQREPALLIGMDILSCMEEVVIDYGRRELQLRARTARVE